MRRYSFFVLDDDPYFVQAVRMALSSEWRVSDHPQRADAALLDIHLSAGADDFAGLEEIRKLRSRRTSLQIIATSGDLNRATMEKALEAGCDLFLAKPLKPKQLQTVLAKVSALLQLRESPSNFSQDKAAWVGSGSASRKIQAQIAALAGENGPILVEGETGTGKEVIASLLHQQEPPRPIVRVNVAAITPNLFESEFYGHIKGSFTGAIQDKIGLIEAADGGDLFLDEVETLEISQQASLLRFLENGEIKPVGGSKSKGVSVRIIAASNQNLEQLVQQKKFREDLYWRLAKHKIQVPPLRERLEDLPALCEWFLAKNENNPKQFTEDGLAALKKHHWPGNVRELQRTCEQLCLASPLPLIRAEEVRSLLGTDKQQPSFPFDENCSLQEALNAVEKKLIESRLRRFEDPEAAAKSLKISRSSLYKKIKDHEIRWERPL